MSDYSIIDRRKNPKGKNLPNRQRFLKRVKKYLGEEIKRNMKTKSITDQGGADINVPNKGIKEPSFDYDQNTGNWEKILPGNKDFIVGDKIKKPKDGSGGGGREGGIGESQDEFQFSISKEEYLQLVFEDLELPDLLKKSEQAATTYHNQRAGYKVNGNPSQLDLVKSLKNSLGRRVALKRPGNEEIDKLKEIIAELEKHPYKADELNEARLKLEGLLRKRSAISWVDPIDIRYRRHEKIPLPNSQAVIFCLMDVSASMGEREKEIAKRFYLLLYLFLQQRYKKVDVVFIRHAERAWECTEEEFFHSTESGGTVISSGLDMIDKIIKDRYDSDHWNIYTVQASDGDNYSSDNPVVEGILNNLLPIMQYYVYLEIKNSYSNDSFFYGQMQSAIWSIMVHLSSFFKNIKYINLDSANEVVNVFRQVFHKDNKK